ncbi:uncharacterized protein [Rhodnius prolixus]|uniref:uncharacterized protein n=1 Tax=Rhodnius prolixus TaxID=13249 RepID=UPI003D18995E
MIQVLKSTMFSNLMIYREVLIFFTLLSVVFSKELHLAKEKRQLHENDGSIEKSHYDNKADWYHQHHHHHHHMEAPHRQTHEESHKHHVKTITITKKVPVPYEVIVEKKVPYKVEIPVDKPYHIYVPKPYPVYVEKKVPYKVEVPVPKPYTVEKKIPVPVKVPVDKPYPVYVPKPYNVYVEKKVPYTLEKHVPYPVKVPVEKPYPVHVKVEKEVPYKVEKIVPYPVEVKVDTPVPVHVEKPIPVKIEKPVPYPVEKVVPYPVKVPVKIPIEVPYHIYNHEQQGHEFDDGGFNSGSDLGVQKESEDFGENSSNIGSSDNSSEGSGDEASSCRGCGDSSVYFAGNSYGFNHNSGGDFGKISSSHNGDGASGLGDSSGSGSSHGYKYHDYSEAGSGRFGGSSDGGAGVLDYSNIYKSSAHFGGNTGRFVDSRGSESSHGYKNHFGDSFVGLDGSRGSVTDGFVSNHGSESSYVYKSQGNLDSTSVGDSSNKFESTHHFGSKKESSSLGNGNSHEYKDQEQSFGRNVGKFYGRLNTSGNGGSFGFGSNSHVASTSVGYDNSGDSTDRNGIPRKHMRDSHMESSGSRSLMYKNNLHFRRSLDESKSLHRHESNRLAGGRYRSFASSNVN